ncbi:MAG: class I SAM-dependent methyltransferase [Candidatus Accumulibacter sp.]|uniref:class I SAM-dependent methyltransferase n=1 Tax=Accumulibacter sp. TaxID=2053492 RepID=UPI00258D27F5|nr:class I SAM-dependent methyltransferase [Accumulibacter sp.]MCM8621978.1 class I SAM-dependent methyltransferase [Accumulibacter sp.]
MSGIALRACPMCGGREIDVLHRQALQQPAGSPLPSTYDVAACLACGFVYADTPATQQDYDRYYAVFSKYEDPAVASGSGIGAFEAGRFEETAAAIASRLSTATRILDIGCAGGGLLTALQRRGFTSLCGVDGAPGCAASVRGLGFEAHCLPLSRLQELKDSGPFDGIVLSHVLEHVADLHPLMATVAALAAPNGRIYLETPDAARYADYPYVPFYFFDSEHINHFDPRQLAALGTRFGLVEEAVGERTLEVAQGKYYPAAWAWLRKNDAPTGTRAEAHTGLGEAVRRYVARCHAMPASPVLQRLALAGTPVIVWGAGSFAQRMFGLGALDACRIVAIADRDRNKQGLQFAGRTIEAPEVALPRHPEAAILILAAVHGAAIAQEVRTLSRDARIEMLDGSPQGSAEGQNTQ